MQNTLVIVLIIISITFFWAWRTGRLTNESLNALAGIITIATGIAAIILIIIPSGQSTLSDEAEPTSIIYLENQSSSATSIPAVPFITSENINWQLNPQLPTASGFAGLISSQSTQEFPSSVWSKNVGVSITEGQSILIFGGLAILPDVGEIGTDTQCFVIVSRGPLDLSIDLMSARMEIYNIDENANSLLWAAQKAVILKDTSPSTCGNGLDVLVGK